MKKPLILATALMGLCITLPIWYFMVYSILAAIHADRLLWFLYWIYMPAGIMASILEKVSRWDDK